MTDSPDKPDEKQDDYRDDPGEFGQSSDLARVGTSDVTTGGGVETSSKDPARVGPGAGNNAGSQEDWRGPKAAAPVEEQPAAEAEDGAGIATSSANLGATLPDGASDADLKKAETAAPDDASRP